MEFNPLSSPEVPFHRFGNGGPESLGFEQFGSLAASSGKSRTWTHETQQPRTRLLHLVNPETKQATLSNPVVGNAGLLEDASIAAFMCVMGGPYFLAGKIQLRRSTWCD